MRRAAVLGAGSWGTTFAKVLGDAGIDVTLLARRPEVARVISEQRSNPDYLPGTTLPEQVTATVVTSALARPVPLATVQLCPCGVSTLTA